MTGLKNRTGLSGATLLYGATAPAPDLVLAAQFLIDDLRRDGWRIAGLRIGAREVRLRVDGFDLAMTLADEPLPDCVSAALMRPSRPAEAPDLARARVWHLLGRHHMILGVLIRARGARARRAIEDGREDLAGICQTLVCTIAEAAPPDLVLWQASGAVLSPAEFRKVPLTFLTLTGADAGLEPIRTAGRPPDSARARAAPKVAELQAPPGGQPGALLAPAEKPDCIAGAQPVGQSGRNGQRPGMPDRPDSRIARAARASSGRLFGKTRKARCRIVISGEGAESERLRRAMRQNARPGRHAARAIDPCRASADNTDRATLPFGFSHRAQNRAKHAEPAAGAAQGPDGLQTAPGKGRSPLMRCWRVALLCVALAWVLPETAGSGAQPSYGGASPAQAGPDARSLEATRARTAGR